MRIVVDFFAVLGVLWVGLTIFFAMSDAAKAHSGGDPRDNGAEE